MGSSPQGELLSACRIAGIGKEADHQSAHGCFFSYRSRPHWIIVSLVTGRALTRTLHAGRKMFLPLVLSMGSIGLPLFKSVSSPNERIRSIWRGARNPQVRAPWGSHLQWDVVSSVNGCGVGRPFLALRVRTGLDVSGNKKRVATRTLCSNSGAREEKPLPSRVSWYINISDSMRAGAERDVHDWMHT